MSRTAAPQRRLVRNYTAVLAFSAASSCNLAIPNTGAITPGAQSFGMAFWFKLGSRPGFTQYLFAYNTTSVANGWVVQQNGLDLRFQIKASSALLVSGALSHAYGDWCHLAVTASAGDQKQRIYLNGALLATSSAISAWNVTATGASSIGDNITGNGFTPVSSRFAELLLFVGAPVSDAEIAQLYLAGTSPASTVARYALGEGSGTTAADSVGGNTGTLGGGAAWSTDGPMKSRSAAPATQNLLAKSQSYSSGLWTHHLLNASDNAVLAPDGTMTAALLTDSVDVSAQLHYLLYQSAPVGTRQTATLSAYAKAGTLSWIQLQEANSGEGVYFDLANGVVGSVFPGLTAGIVSAGGGWWRVWVTGAAPALTGFDPALLMSAGNNGISYQGTGAGTLALWGAQLVTANWPGPYQPTTTAAVNTGGIRSLANGRSAA